MQYGLGYIPDLPDHRDWPFAASAQLPPTLPVKVDLRPQTYPRPCYDQQSANSCTGNSTGAMFGFVDRKQGGANINPSRRQIYYDARALDGLESIDRGAYIRSALKTLADKGVAPEEMFSYDVGKINEQPPPAVYATALLKQALAYLRLDINVDAMRACLAEGYPFVLGSSLFENFYDGHATGMIPMPSGSFVGGHALMYVGYDDAISRFIVQGSWGTWGDDGFIYMPYSYAANEDYSADCWTIRSLEEVAPPPPPPGQVPVITYVSHYKLKKQMIVVDADNTDSGAVLLIDNKRIAGSQDGIFTAKRLGLTEGDHILIVQNGSGSMSEPHVLTV